MTPVSSPPAASRIVFVVTRASGGENQALLERYTAGENQSLPRAIQERPSVWYSGAYGRGCVKGIKQQVLLCCTATTPQAKRNICLQGGFLPNVFKVLSHRPAEFRAFFSYYNELMNKETGLFCSFMTVYASSSVPETVDTICLILCCCECYHIHVSVSNISCLLGRLTKADRELIVVATSAHNKCLYCVVSHSALHRIYSKKPTLSDQVPYLIDFQYFFYYL